MLIILGNFSLYICLPLVFCFLRIDFDFEGRPELRKELSLESSSSSYCSICCLTRFTRP